MPMGGKKADEERQRQIVPEGTERPVRRVHIPRRVSPLRLDPGRTCTDATAGSG